MTEFSKKVIAPVVLASALMSCTTPRPRETHVRLTVENARTSLSHYKDADEKASYLEREIAGAILVRTGRLADKNGNPEQYFADRVEAVRRLYAEQPAEVRSALNVRLDVIKTKYELTPAELEQLNEIQSSLGAQGVQAR